MKFTHALRLGGKHGGPVALYVGLASFAVAIGTALNSSKPTDIGAPRPPVTRTETPAKKAPTAQKQTQTPKAKKPSTSPTGDESGNALLAAHETHSKVSSDGTGEQSSAPSVQPMDCPVSVHVLVARADICK